MAESPMLAPCENMGGATASAYENALAVSRPVSASGSGSPMARSCAPLAGGRRAGERGGQRVAKGGVVRAAGGAEGDRGIGRSAAELVSAIGTDPEDGGIAV